MFSISLTEENTINKYSKTPFFLKEKESKKKRKKKKN